MEMYPSESSLSTLSLPTAEDTDYHSSDYDDYQYSSNNKPPRHPLSSTNNKDYSSSSDTELSAVIAGVNKKLHGKITPLNKRQRRRKKKSSRGGGSRSSDISSVGSYLSDGSLLDEVIHEESDEQPTPYANYLSDDAPPAVIDASPTPRRRKKKSPSKSKERNRSRSSSSKKKNKNVGVDPPDDDEPLLSGYESNHHSGAEESISSKAARARRNRILSKRGEHEHPIQNGDSVGDLVIASLPVSAKRSKPEVVDRGMNNRPPPSVVIVTDGDGKGGNKSEQYESTESAAWQARKVRMARLRMIRGHTYQQQDENDNHTNNEDDNDEEVIRADGIVLACSDDEDSI